MIRAVLFDVYGTLFEQRALGDDTHGVSDARQARLNGLAREYAKDLNLKDLSGEDLKNHFLTAVAKSHRAGRKKTPFPEVRVEEIWADFLRAAPAAPKDLDRAARELAMKYEEAVNPVAPMPGARETMVTLKAAGLTLGIISNAQFFTPRLFETLFGGSPEALGFDRELLIYSYEMGEAKPSPRLFDRARETLAGRGIKGEECLFVGNDIINDINGGSRAGFKTALLSGDDRSLRVHEKELPPGAPSVIIRRLEELIRITEKGDHV